MVGYVCKKGCVEARTCDVLHVKGSSAEALTCSLTSLEPAVILYKEFFVNINDSKKYYIFVVYSTDKPTYEYFMKSVFWLRAVHLTVLKVGTKVYLCISLNLSFNISW